MKILIDGSLLRGARTGSFTYLSNLLGHLVVEDRDNEYFVLDYPQLFQTFSPPGIIQVQSRPLLVPSHFLRHKNPDYFSAKVYNRIVPPLADWLYTPWVRVRMRSILQGINIYSVYEHGLFAHRRGTTLITIHDITTRTHPHLHLASNRRFHERKIRFAEQHADVVVTDAQSTVQDLLEHTRIDAGRIRVIYPGVDPVMTYMPAGLERDGLLERFGLDTGPFLLGVGTLEPRKNWPAVLKVYELLRQKPGYRDLKLVIAGGKGWLATDILQMVEAHPNREGIVMPGFVTPAELLALYSACAVFLFPSLYEGFGLPALEAMRCCAPVICSNVSSLPEAAGKGALQTAPDAYEEMAFHCERLLDDSAYRQERIEAGLHWSEQFSWINSARKMIKLYRELS